MSALGSRLGKGRRLPVGQILQQAGLVTEAQLEAALNQQRLTGRRLGEVLIEQGVLSEADFLMCLSQHLDAPLIDLSQYPYSAERSRALPESYARRYRALLLGEDEHSQLPLVAMADPANLTASDHIAQVLGSPIRSALVSEQHLAVALDLVYRRTEEISNLAESLREEIAEDDLQFESAESVDSDTAANAPVTRLIHSLFQDAMQVRASDIHLEPDENQLRIRQRVDGVLQEQVVGDRRIASSLVARIKLMAGLDIAEKRLPQDGRIKMRAGDRPISVRVSTLPVHHGESVVMRIHDHGSRLLRLGELGLTRESEALFRQQIARPHGMLLVTGPTGSGKTTSLYAALQEINTPERKIITVEDPVEYTLERINQVQVNNRVGLDFAKVLRSVLRQDPDVVMVGEMRDKETVEIGIRAAMTGHLVLSTLHTNSAISTIDRLIDMGVEGYMVAAALNAVISQQLVRRICESCGEDDPLDEQQQAWLGGVASEEVAGARYRRGRGCVRCHHTGYRGRVGLHEILVLDRAMVEALRRRDFSVFAAVASGKKDFKPLVQSGLEAAASGITTVAEVFRVAGELDRFSRRWVS